jgi:CspA family cold shock protein
MTPTWYQVYLVPGFLLSACFAIMALTLKQTGNSMRFFVQLAIGLIAAAGATAIIVTFNFTTPLMIGVTIAAATSLVSLLSLLPRGARASARSGRGSSAGLEREEGEVKWFNVSKGFGFIRRDNGEEIFVHFRSIEGEDKGRRSLRDGQRVSYVVVDSDKGPQAEEVIPL